MNDFPSGIQTVRKRLRSIPFVTSMPSPPLIGAIHIAFWLPRALPCECQYEMCVPSGEKTGCVSSDVRVVRRFTSPVATSTSATREMFGVASCGVSRRGIAIVFPSGDHESGDGAGPGGCAIGTLHAPLVTRRDFALFASTIQTCDGVTAVVVR